MKRSTRILLWLFIAIPMLLVAGRLGDILHERVFAQTKPDPPKVVAKDSLANPEKASIGFTASDAAKIAKIQAQASSTCGEANQRSYISINDILKPYNIPEGSEIVKDADGNWIGTRLAVKKP